MRSLLWNLIVWNPSAGPADPYGAPRFTRVVWAIRARQRAVFLIAGGSLMVLGLELPSPVAFVAGLLMLGMAAPSALPFTPATATVRTWEWLRKSR